MVETRRRPLAILAGIFNWAVWLLMAVLVCSQFLGIVWDTTSSVSTAFFGRDPRAGLGPLSGFNDEPYADRAIVCLTQGRVFVPTQLSNVLTDRKLAPIVDTNGSSINGFRVVTRDNKMTTLQQEISTVYARYCDRIDFTLEAIQDSCNALGFDVTRDSLRIVDGVNSKTTREITRALPVLIMPFADNGVHVSVIIPASDGSVCMLRVRGMYQSATENYAVLRGVPKSADHPKMVEWLGKPGGMWRNGWYEAPDGQRWYTVMHTTRNGGPYGIEATSFDAIANKEIDCSAPEKDARCRPVLIINTWGHQLTTTTAITRADNVFATNGSRFGLFLYDASMKQATKNVYSLETFISNIVVFIILIRWFVSLAAMLYGYVTGATAWQNTGVGALSSSRTFNLLPFSLLPKLKLTLCAFFTVGCYFEGQQFALASAWYLIYPAIVEFLLFYYSLLNLIARMTYRRMSDALFGPTLLTLCALHYFRKEITGLSWIGLNERVPTLILSGEVDALRLIDFFSANAAMRLNGNAKPIFYLKMALLVVNLLPLLLAEDMTVKRGKKARAFTKCDIERVLALRASNVGGLGRSPVYVACGNKSTKNPRLPIDPLTGQPTAPLQTDLLRSRTTIQPFHGKSEHESDAKDALRPPGPGHALIGYEMSRLGYLVFGGRFLLSFDDWYILTSLAPLRWVEKLWNYRIIVFDVATSEEGDGSYPTYRIVGPPRLCRIDDPKLRAIPFHRVTVCAFQ